MLVLRTGRLKMSDDVDYDDDDDGSELEQAHLESDLQCIGIPLIKR